MAELDQSDSPADGRANQGKIPRLPHALRAQLNQRLLNGEQSPTLLPWLNSLPEVQKILAAEFNGEPISGRNLSRWRLSGYQHWLARRDRLSHIKDLSAYAADIARAGGETLAQGAINIASGQILELLETLESAGGKLDSESAFNIARALNALRVTEQNNTKLDLEKNKLSIAQQQLMLQRQRFQRQTLELFLKWRADQRALEIADAPADNSAKIEKLGALIFGEDWKPSAGSQP
jgi:hypothetical protein